MNGDAVIRAEGLGKKYFLGHESERENYLAMRDVLTRVGGLDWCVTEFIRVCDRLLPDSSFHKLAPELADGSMDLACRRSIPTAW